jgi:hypothetical protein
LGPSVTLTALASTLFPLSRGLLALSSKGSMRTFGLPLSRL